MKRKVIATFMAVCMAIIATVFLYLLSIRPPESCMNWGNEDFHEDASEKTLIDCLNAGANPNIKGDYGTPALSLAISYTKNLELIQLFLDKGANPNRGDVFDRTALHWAMFSNSAPAIVDVLIDAGADVNAKDEDGITPLAQLMQNEPEVGVNVTLIERLVDAGANINFRNDNGETLLHIAVEHYASATTLKALIAHNIDFGIGLTALDVLLCKEPNVEKVRIFLEAEPNLTAPDPWGRTPLSKAIWCRAPIAVLKTLIEAGAPVNSKDENGNTPFHNFWLYDGFGPRAPKAIAMMIDAGADVNAQNADADTALMLEVILEDSNPKIIKILLSAGADVTIANEYQQTALHWLARYSDEPSLIQHVIDVGADINARDENGQTPLHWAAEDNRHTVVDMLLKMGADASIKDNNGQAPNELIIDTQ
ncbi:hypothetical protein F9L33_04845 [Amylibacter sp. SFDW26]|uniref:ankyrin repeat domain-containing protein n=1 Tax=Amylibacter sp. SFDW26 TaxID=2652722 RepID=UPI001262038D|nr:ankyrin repeat domain-containing protein [Amylibacter sp. SFDW26]KAB7616093.1 hypothetical protein F9L33_04845 [Amylibacter sp. SFDW26]